MTDHHIAKSDPDSDSGLQTEKAHQRQSQSVPVLVRSRGKAGAKEGEREKAREEAQYEGRM
jgi:hypothetical protein